MRGLGDVLQATLENAVRAPYYARAFGRKWKQVHTLDDLSRLPLLDKPTAIRVQRELITGDAPAGFGIASSGTTRQNVDLPPLNVLADVDPPPDLAGDDVAGEEDDDPFPGWTLVSIAVTHGLPPAPPGRDELHVPWMYDRNALYMLESVLSSPQPDRRRVTAMRISVGALKSFTAWMLERGKPLDALGVRLIGTNSFRLSPFWRALIERKWDAEVFDNYSLSELATPATECKACGWKHFGWPPLVYEVLDLASGARLDRGAGRLVATTLWPHVRTMPLIRYDTGDVVELGPRCRATGQRGIHFLGRVRRGLVVEHEGRGAYLLAPTTVQDVLEALPDTERSVHPLVTLGHLKTRDIGLPRWTVERDGDVVRLSFEVRFDPLIFEAHARALEASVRRDVLALDKPLRALVRRRAVRFEVKVHPAKALVPPPDKHD